MTFDEIESHNLKSNLAKKKTIILLFDWNNLGSHKKSLSK